MDKIFEDDGTVLIKTYCFESGLWYLAKSLGDLLKSQGHKVLYVPKSKYELMSASFRRTYKKPHNQDDFADEDILHMQADKTINAQLLNHIVKHDVKYLISFETLMEKGSWITPIKRRFRNKIQIIDVPMAEWVNERYLQTRSYRMFDEVWCLNDMTFKIMKEQENARRIDWPVVDKSVFNKRHRKRSKDEVHFLHLASTNPDYSSKNTEAVLRVFDQFVRQEKVEDAFLHIQGAMPKNSRIIVEKHTNITNNSELVTREELSKLYKKSDCIVAPSSREGLSLSLYEGLASGCKVITTDTEPMNYIETPYLCEVITKKRDRSIVPIADINENHLFKLIKRAYEDIKNE